MNFGALIRRTFETAHTGGHVIFTPSTSTSIECAGISFQVRFAPSLAKKPKSAMGAAPKSPETPSKPAFNPFLPPDKNLLVDAESFVAHNLVLNKFSVVKGHSILTTKVWESQSAMLSESDFEASLQLLHNSGDLDFLAFFNCGPLSGASVPHKHIQFLPVVLKDGDEDSIPIQPCIRGWHQSENPPNSVAQSIPTLPFLHRAVFFSQETTPALLRAAYQNCLREAFQAANILISTTTDNIVTDAITGKGLSYNVLFTTTWLLVVPRKAETASNGVSVNSVGFAGMLLAKSKEQLDMLTGASIVGVFKDVAY